MDLALIISNITNPTVLFFLLGIVAVRQKGDLEIPATTAQFVSLYLLFSIGFKGGQVLAHSPFAAEIFCACMAIAAILLLDDIIIHKRFFPFPTSVPALHIPMVLGVVFQLNITPRMPLHEWLVLPT